MPGAGPYRGRRGSGEQVVQHGAGDDDCGPTRCSAHGGGDTRGHGTGAGPSCSRPQEKARAKRGGHRQQRGPALPREAPPFPGADWLRAPSFA